jgi:outer membrane receptor protein involved in Fe transport
LGVSYDWTPETTLGLSVRKGYTPGGGGVDWKTSAFYEYDKEEVLTYEATSRSNLFGNRMNLGATIFFNQYKGYQANVAGTTDRIQNLDRARSFGLEIESTVKATRDLEVFGSIGTLKSEITSGQLTEIDTSGNDMSYAPSFTANLGFKQQLPYGLFVGGNANYVGEYYSDVANVESLKAGDYTVVNANAGWSNKAITVRAYVKNLTDKLVIYRQNSSGEAQVGAPRTFGLTVDYKF